MTIIINRNQRIAGTHYAENQQLTLGAATETDWVNKGWARWAPGSEPRSPEPLYAIPSDGGIVITAGANGLANIVTPGGYAERVVTAPHVADNRLVAVDYLPYLALAENSKWIMAKSDGADTTAQRVLRSDGSMTAGVVFLG